MKLKTLLHAISLATFALIVTLCFSCKKGATDGGSTPPPTNQKKATLPTVNIPITDIYTGTTAPYVAAHDSIVGGGEVLSDGGSAVTARGLCWSTSQNPTIADSKTADGSGTGAYASHINGLKVNTAYYLRAYATNSVGTAYSSQISLTTAYLIGENFGGGIIFYIDQTTLHGLIKTQYSMTETIWGTGVAGAYSSDDGTGNTDKIIQAFGANAQNAATLCRNCRDGGYSDWFLPAINQLELLGIPPNGDTYWSSTESSNNIVWAYVTSPPYGNPYAELKSVSHEVRPMRAF